ncbi:glycosyltransferase family 4 protein [Desertibacillus haloalkaliphilus]|uniref:glycosyltransferase family 4 protein n=1 Tax=Desertibacillus haloalkaliphilus TaxID=1328930 RepID=UPI001C25A32C|nr:glycosyltransferase family 4 protein [Desertibacillus haloalkaliphilus]MBU8906552.1 glycosyltransferase family 4 protein [Desertibacillus haloalkaliphilus]
MDILHICSYYIGNQLYKNLIKEISENGVKQHIFIPLKDKKFIGKNQLTTDNNINYYYKNILQKHDKFLYFNKINKQLKEIERSILANQNVTFIHAHTVFSDGGTAYKLNKKYGMKYIVTVRNTDLNSFYKYGIHLRPFMYKILLNAEAVIFISHAYKNQMFSLLPYSVLSKIKERSIVVPNGIDNYWHENNLVKEVNHIPQKEILLLFIGLIDRNKNLESVILSCAKLCEEGYNAKLHVIGEGPLEDECRDMTKRLNIEKRVVFHGYIREKQTILSIMCHCDIFVMPSFKETFGLVYIEAMSVGLPVLYSKGQGIDGFYIEGEIGYSVEPSNINSITKAILNILKNYNDISNNCVKRSKDFKWDIIVEKYLQLYSASDK